MQWVRGDLGDAEATSRAIAGVAEVVHAAAAVAGNAAETLIVNVEGVRRLAEAVRRAGVRRVIHVSSAGVYGDGHTGTPHTESSPLAAATPYERSKLEGEAVLCGTLADTVPWVILRPAGLHGPGRPATAAFYRGIRDRRVWPHGPVPVIVHPTYVDDVVHAVIATLDRPDLASQIYNIGGEQALDYRDLIGLVAGELGARLWQPRAPGLLSTLARGLTAVGLRSESVERLGRHVINRAVNTTKARAHLGWRPVPLQDAVRHTIAQLRTEGRV